MPAVSQLVERHRGVFQRPEFHWDSPTVRLRLDVVTDGVVESWLAATMAGKLELNRVDPGAGEPHGVLTVPLGDLERHLRGEVDMFAVPQRAYRFDLGPATDPAQPSARLFSLTMRLLAVLGVPCHVRERFHGSVMEGLYLSYRSLRKDGTHEPMGDWSLPLYAAQRLYDLVRAERPARTLEIGLAHGLSGLFIAQALRDNGHGTHIAIDPCQTSLFGGCGVANLERAGLADLVQVIEEPNYTALPRLLGQKLQLVFIDGLHLFDHVLLDFFYSDLLLDVGGHLVFDDANLAGVKDALGFVMTNRFDGYEREDALCTDRVSVFRKVAEDERFPKYGPLFHRPFTAAAATPDPLPKVAASHTVKHAIERTVALLGMLLLSPVFLLTGAAIAARDLARGGKLRLPLQRRRSFSAGREFDLLSFRAPPSHSAPGGGAARRGTRLQRLLLARLPQLWHVLKGDMSFVGLSPIPANDTTRRAMFRECGIRTGVFGQYMLEPPFIGDQRYYEQCAQRGALAILALDAAVLAKIGARALRLRRVG